MNKSFKHAYNWLVEESGESSVELVSNLKLAFVKTFMVEQQARYFHWNVVGKDFVQLHDFFGEEYDNYSNQIDVIAEHIRQQDFAIVPKVEKLDFSIEGNEKQMVSLFEATVSDALVAWENVDKVANDVKNPQSIDLSGEMTRMLSKTKWKIGAILS